MGLDDLSNKLHSRDLHLNRVRVPDAFNPGDGESKESVVAFKQTENWTTDTLPAETTVASAQAAGVVFEEITKKRRRKILAMVLGGIACVVLIGVIAMKLQAALFHENKITLQMSGPNDVRSAEPVTFTLEYGNDNWLALHGNTVVFEYPETFHPDAATGLSINKSRAELVIGDIPSRGHGRITLSGKFYGARGDQVTLRATLRYTPSNTTSAYDKQVEHSIHVASSPLLFEIIAPQERASDQEVQYDIRYRNNGDSVFSNLKVKMDYPEGFIFTEADPRPSDGTTVWAIGDLAVGQEGTIAIRGRVSGIRDEQKSVHGGIGIFQGDGNFIAYGENERKTKIVASPFSIHQSIEGSLDTRTPPGEVLHYLIEYKNEGNVGVRDAIITVEIDSLYLNLSTLSFDTQEGKGGSYNSSLHAIIWKASDIKSLARIEPGQVGSVKFSVATYGEPEKRGTAVRNPSVKTVAKIDSPDIPAIVGITKVVASNALTVKLNTVLESTLEARYQDDTFPNTGALPPVVGQETTYTVHVVYRNSTNDINNARVSVLLPTGIRYTGKKAPDGEKVLFNERTNELVWEIGLFTPEKQREIIFQIGVIPAPSSFGKQVVLVSQVVFTGKDSFTDHDVKLEKSNGASTAFVGAAPDTSSSSGTTSQ